MNTDVGALIAKSVLAAVAAALLCAGLYALFGKPHTSEGKKRKNHIVHGFQVGGGIVLGIILMASVVGGSQIAFGVVPGSTLSRWEGLFVALLAFVLVFLLIRWWAKYFAGWIGYSVWNGLLMARLIEIDTESPAIAHYPSKPRLAKFRKMECERLHATADSWRSTVQLSMSPGDVTQNTGQGGFERYGDISPVGSVLTSRAVAARLVTVRPTTTHSMALGLMNKYD